MKKKTENNKKKVFIERKQLREGVYEQKRINEKTNERGRLRKNERTRKNA